MGLLFLGVAGLECVCAPQFQCGSSRFEMYVLIKMGVDSPAP